MNAIVTDPFALGLSTLELILNHRLKPMANVKLFTRFWLALKAGDINLHVFSARSHFETLWDALREQGELVDVIVKINNELQMRMGTQAYENLCARITDSVIPIEGVDTVIDEEYRNELPDEAYEELLKVNTWIVPIWLLEVMDATPYIRMYHFSGSEDDDEREG